MLVILGVTSEESAYLDEEELKRLVARAQQEKEIEEMLAPAAVTFCHTNCGRPAVMPGPHGEAFCEVCAKREARLILKQRRQDFEARRRAGQRRMAIPKKRRQG